MNIRVDKVQSALLHEISDIVRRELDDPRLGIVTITGVRVTADLQHATVFVSVFGDEDAIVHSVQALKRASGFIHNQLGRRIHLKRVPVLEFRADDTIKRSSRIMELLHQVENDLKPEKSE
ncbi:MAG: 30S ribosome-binding factor RbfA [bacterium]|jgi:ribosome-binding factor A